MTFRPMLMCVVEMIKEDSEKEALAIHNNYCLWLIATKRIDKKFKPYSETLKKVKNNNIVDDNRTSREIIENTKNLFR